MKEVYIKGCDPAPELEHASPDAEIWGLNSQRKNPPPRASKWFQLHGLGHIFERHGADYFRWMSEFPGRFYMFEAQIIRWPEFVREYGMGELPLPVRDWKFPEKIVCAPQYGGDYKTNTIDWLMAFAMAYGYGRIHLVGMEYSMEGLWKSRRQAAQWIEDLTYWYDEPREELAKVAADLRGVCVGDVAGDESWARCSIEYYIGLAQGMGIEVTWNKGSGLMVNHHGGRYGLDCAGNE